MLEWTADYLSGKGFENPRLTAELLLGHVLQLKRIDLYLQFDRLLTQVEVTRYKQALQQRLQHVPIQYIFGHAEFYSLSFVVNEAVLIPRPETEILVETVLKRLPDIDGDLLLADIGTGAGIIAIVLAYETPSAMVYATDCSAEALEVAKGNACRHGLAESIVFLEGDLLAPLRDLKDTHGAPLRFDAIISNPPYIAHNAMKILPAEIRNYEPWLALDGGPDGLTFSRRLVAEASGFLKTGGFLAVEVGDGQADAVVECIGEQFSFGEVQRIADLNGVARVVITQKVEA